MREYEALKVDHFEPNALNAVAELPTVPIKTRIAQDLRSKDLAAQLGPQTQQMQRYEVADYATASLTRIRGAHTPWVWR